MEGVLGISHNILSGAVASLVVGLFYTLAAVSRSRPTGGSWRANPLVITAGVFGRASLSNFQVFFFSLIVFWALTYHVVQEGTLVDLSPDILYLLGIGATGTAGAKVTAVTRKRLSFENWAWLKRKKWISQNIGRPRRPPQWTDLITSEETFDVYKFQTLVVNFIVGVALVVAGVTGTETDSLKNFAIPENLLGLLGLSQAINVGGKAIGPATNADLDAQLNKLRQLEQDFVAAVANEWMKTRPSPTDMAAAIKAAPAEYNAYLTTARQTAVMVQERTGAAHPPTNVDPELPTI